MQTFKDSGGHAWTIDLNVGTVIRVKDASGGRFNLFDPESRLGERTLLSVLFAEQMSDWPTVWEVIYLVIEPQLTGKYDSAAQFALAMPPECLVAGQRALLSEWRDFFQGLQRPDLATTLEKQTAYHQKAVELVQEKLKDPVLSQIDARVEAKMRQTLNSSLGDWAESCDSILGPTPSESSAT
jgi:hypothetical protein